MSVPKYIKIRDAILSDIRSGLLKKGDKLPKRDELILKYSVTRTTIDKALSELIDSGVLNSVRRLGTFVSTQDLPRKVVVASKFTGTMPLTDTRVGQSDMQQLFRALFNSKKEIKLDFIDIADALKNKRFHEKYEAVALIHPDKKLVERLKEISRKTIISNRYYEGFNFVSTNHRKAIREVTEHYIKLCPDNSQLFYLGWDLEDFVSEERKEGFIEACAAHNKFYRICPMCPSKHQRNFEKLMKLDIHPAKPVIMTAGSCNMTGAVLRMAAERKLKLWDNLFYSDFDNEDSLERIGVQVTTIIQDYYSMGEEMLKSIPSLPENAIHKFIPYKIEGLRF